MRRREFFAAIPVCASLPHTIRALAANQPEPIPEPHFPSRLYLYIWRNWELANVSRMAQVIRTTGKTVLDLGYSMGLPRKRTLSAQLLARLFITVIRQNWHILPEEQIIALLGWDRERFEFALKEDDALDIKLGVKPHCPELVYEPPPESARSAAAEVRAAVREMFGDSIHRRGEDLFHFIDALSDPAYPELRDRSLQSHAGEADLSHSWSIEAPPELAPAADRFRAYMRQAMGANVASAAAGRRIRLSIDPDVRGTESFHTRVTTDQITIAAGDRGGILQAIYRLQDQMERREAPFLAVGELRQKAIWSPRYLYSFFAMYGDPLLDSDRDPLPEAYLEKLARCGINGVWMQAVLNTLAPSTQFPEFGENSGTRLRNLNRLIERARRFNIKLYLYLNEPRAMPAAFFSRHPDIRGASHRNVFAMCTSTPQVRQWIEDSLAHVAGRAPGIGGFFCITMSENHTNCFSHGGAWTVNTPTAGDCPRCSKRSGWETIAELIGTFRAGIRRHNSTADLIVWDWGWGDGLAENLIPLLPGDARFLSVSEWDAPVRRGGVESKVGEYSISVVGPGPRAARNWSRARAAGLQSLAKIQANNTWEISAVPYIPVLHLVAEHCENLTKAGISGIMPSWTCGGYASPNLMALREYAFESKLDRAELLRRIAVQRYGSGAAVGMIEAWRRFSDAFRQFPYGVQVYIIPTQHGPANPLRLAPTGYKPGMILYPYDDYKAWCGRYRPDVVQRQFAEMAKLWRAGLDLMESTLRAVSSAKRGNAKLDLAIARTCFHHFQSTANQVEFYLLRDGPRTPEASARMRAIAREEIEIARRQFEIARNHSVIAFEASNHYYYTPLDLVEKALQCRYVAGQLDEKRIAATPRG